MANELASQIRVKLGGSQLARATQDQISEVIVEQHTHLPAMFTISFIGSGLDLLDKGPIDLTKEIEVIFKGERGTEVSLIKGEITSLEPRFQDSMIIETVIRGFDKSHRLYRETKSKAYLNIKDSDLASQFAGSAGLGKQIDATSTVYDALYQDNQSDLEFLKQRAWRIGYECFVDAGKLYFRKPPDNATTTTLTYGDNLASFYPRMSLAEQVDEVQVKGWDMKTLKPIIGKAQSGKLYPKIGESKNGASWASSFGTGKKILVDHPVMTQAEANKIAQARLDEYSGAFVTADGVAIRTPDIRAGNMVKLEELGKRFNGTYLVTSARHIYNAKGLITEFSVRGTRSGLLFDQMTHQSPVERWGGVVPAIVTNTDDPEKLGRLKLKYPWMSEDSESYWARVASPGAGKNRGFCLLPDVGDEVLVAFEHGDINRPYVLGGLWNGKAEIPDPVSGAAAQELPLVRSWHSTNGNEITMYDNADKKIEIKTADGHVFVFDDKNKTVALTTAGGHSVSCDDQGKKLQIETTGGNKITCDDASKNLKVEDSSGNSITMGPGNVTIESKGNLTIKATGNLTIQGAMVNIN